jgi:hypothetical protein
MELENSSLGGIKKQGMNGLWEAMSAKSLEFFFRKAH